MKFRKLIFIFLIIVLLILTGFFREYVFRTINFIISNRNFYEDSNMQTFLSAKLLNLTDKELIILKWALTLLFSIIFLLYTILLSYFIFSKTSYTNTILFIYGAGIILSFLASMIGMMIPEINDSTYYFARIIMGSEQSPLLTGIIILSLKANERYSIK